jgi:hypothetical protein
MKTPSREPRASWHMIALVKLLFQDRFRKLYQHYGWMEYGSVGLTLLLLGWLSAASMSPYVRLATASRLEILIGSIWIMWTLAATVTGKDLSWRIGLERIRIFPSLGFIRFYFLTFILGFLSFPLFIGLFVIQYWVWLRGTAQFSNVLATSIGYGLFVTSVRLSGSLGRSILHFRNILSPFHKRMAALLAFILVVFTLFSFSRPGIRAPHPGRLFAQLISGEARMVPLDGMILWCGLLLWADFILKREQTYSCVQLMTPGIRWIPFSTMFVLNPLWPGPVFRIGILGWLRSRAAFMLFIWGGTYSFLWTYFCKSVDVSYFFLFIIMNLIFHCHLRGNILGMDRGAAWFYYRFPVRIEQVLSSKSLSLSFLQGCMIAALFASAFLRARSNIKAMDWVALFSYAVSAIELGEISGFFPSILYPESIDRNSQFDGGATVGNIAVGVLQFMFMILFYQAYRHVRRFGLPGLYYGLFLSVPLFLCMIRSIVLKTWVSPMMWAKRETILKKLAWF